MTPLANKVYCTWSPRELGPEDEAELAALPYAPKAIGLWDARQLRRLCNIVKPGDIIEVGTYMGVSTKALQAAGLLVTCDTGKPPAGCLFPSNIPRRVFTYWETASTDMLRQLVVAGVLFSEPHYDLIFYDANVRTPDPDLLKQLIHPNTVFAFHDFIGGGKGVRGVQAIWPIVPDHKLVAPKRPKKSHVAVLAPEAIAQALAC